MNEIDEMIDRGICPSCTWRGDTELENGICPQCGTNWIELQSMGKSNTGVQGGYISPDTKFSIGGCWEDGLLMPIRYRPSR